MEEDGENGKKKKKCKEKRVKREKREGKLKLLIQLKMKYNDYSQICRGWSYI